MPIEPLAIDLFCGLGGWTEGLLAEGYEVVGFDLERHRHTIRCRPCLGGCHDLESAASARCKHCDGLGLRVTAQYPAQLVLQDVLTLHGSQFRHAAVIVASPPCQNYSYLAMPWSRSSNPDNSKAAKALRLKWETEGPDNRLFDACFRIQREAIEATRCKYCCGAGTVSSSSELRRGDSVRCGACDGTGGRRHIPLIVENVRGAQPWVGRSAWNYGSFHLWGDVPALMPINLKSGRKVQGARGNDHSRNDGGNEQSGSTFGTDGIGQEHARAQENGSVLDGMGTKGRAGGGWFGDGTNGVTRKSDPRDVRKQPDGSWMTPDGTKIGGDWFRDPACHSKHGSRSSARKMASAQISKIPLALAQHIAQVYKPR